MERMEHEREVLAIANRPGQEKAKREGLQDFRRVMHRPVKTNKRSEMGMFWVEFAGVMCFMALCYLVAIFL